MSFASKQEFFAFAAQCEAGNVYFVEGAWNQNYVDALCEFPSGGKDEVDATSSAFSRFVLGESTYQSDLSWVGEWPSRRVEDKMTGIQGRIARRIFGVD